MKKALAAVLVVFVGCATTGQPRVDSSSEASFFESLNAINQSLSESEQRDLVEALMVIQLTDAESVTDVFAHPELEVFTSPDLRMRLEGMAFDDILKYAKRSLGEFEAADDGS